jgi:ornithine decarboxylase
MRIVQLHDEVSVNILKDNPMSMISSKINCTGREDKDDAFFMCDLGDVVRKHRTWVSELPHVMPYYAVKCNDNPAVLSTLAKLGVNFDCASKAEIQKVLKLAGPERIIYANPCKQTAYIKYAAKHDVALMTFDNEGELHKIKTVYPTAKLVVRIVPPDPTKAQCPLGLKFGVDVVTAYELLAKAKELSLDVVGVSFHVGSGCYDASVYAGAVKAARLVFDFAKSLGFEFNLLDIGGGFPGSTDAKISFEEICQVLRPALEVNFPAEEGTKIIAEPGRFFVASAFTLVCNVIAKRKKCLVGGEELMYYINDGVYGSFNCLLFDHQEVTATLLHPEVHLGKETLNTSIWGPTCDSLDCVVNECKLPELEVGDWLVFHNMGAYTMAAASQFNGMPKSKCYYGMQDHFWTQMNEEDDLLQEIMTPTQQLCIDDVFLPVEVA